MTDIEKWLVKILREKNQQGIKCEISPYTQGSKKKYMFFINGQLRNIENFLQPEEIVDYRLLQQEDAWLIKKQ
jgi:hypothetical protein